MGNTNKNWLSMTGGAIVSVIGSYVKKERLRQNKTQANVAESAGVNRWTVSQIENGEAISLVSLIQILRALNRLDVFENFQHLEPQVSPLELAKMDKEMRQRASRSNLNKKTTSEW